MHASRRELSPRTGRVAGRSVAETEAAVSRLHDEPKGLLRVNAPMSFGTLYLSSAIADE